MAELYGQWLSKGVYQFTEGGNMQPPSRKRITEWVLDAWSQLFNENIKCCGLNLANDGTEDDFIHCLKNGQPCKAGRKAKTEFPPTSLVDESDAVNLFISPSKEEDANEEMNVIKDETDEKIIIIVCSFFNRLSRVKEKTYISNTSNL